MGTGKPYTEYYLARPFREAVRSGKLDEALVDEKVRRNLRVMFQSRDVRCKPQFGASAIRPNIIWQRSKLLARRSCF